MTKKDYEKIALVFQDMEPDDNCKWSADDIWEGMREAFCIMLKADNGAFKPERFRAACKRGANVKARS